MRGTHETATRQPQNKMNPTLPARIGLFNSQSETTEAAGFRSETGGQLQPNCVSPECRRRCRSCRGLLRVADSEDMDAERAVLIGSNSKKTLLARFGRGGIAECYSRKENCPLAAPDPTFTPPFVPPFNNSFLHKTSFWLAPLSVWTGPRERLSLGVRGESLGPAGGKIALHYATGR
jgi:hypothetical protein